MQTITNPCFYNDFRKNQRNKNKIFSRERNSLLKIALAYEETRVKLKNSQLIKFKSAAKNNIWNNIEEN